ncbi:MAG: ABC transporter permease [Waddliaceae bacterium]
MKEVLIGAIASVGAYVLLISQVFWVALKRPPRWPLIRDQMYEMGVLSLPVIAITGLSTGMVLAAQSYFQLSDKGLASATGLMVTKAMLVELGPVLTAFMITGRVGAAMCAEIGTMKVTEQIDAMRSMSVDPNGYLIAPRFISGVIVLPLLTTFSCVMGVWGGYLVAVSYYGLPHTDFIDPLPVHITKYDLFTGMTKAILFGIIIVTISCYKGLRTRGGAAGVGRSTTNSVVICYTVILVANFIITITLNNAHDYLVVLGQRIEQWLI